MFKVRIFVLLIIAIYSTYTDIKEQKIKNKAVLLGLASGLLINLVEGTYTYIAASIMVFSILLIAAFIDMKLYGGSIGGGDIKLISIVPLFLHERFIDFFMIMMIMLIISTVIKHIKKGDVILAPFILVSIVISLV